MAVREFDLVGTRLRVKTPDDFNLTPLMLLIGRLRMRQDDGSAPAFVLEARYGDLAPAPDWPMVWQGELPEGAPGRLHESDSGMYLCIDDRLTLTASVEHGHAEIVVTEGNEILVGQTAAVLAVECALMRSGQQMIHGACLHFPGEKAGILISAPSGVGKTTTSLALGRAGFPFGGDDAAVLTRVDGACRLWSLPRAPKVHRKTPELLPWIAPIMPALEYDDEESVPFGKFEEVFELAGPEPVPLAALVILGERTGAEHRISRIDKASALIRAASDNVFRTSRGLGMRDRGRFTMLAEAARNAVTLELRVGRDLSTVGDALRSALAGSR